jgi:hypothetical protein
MFGQQNKLKQLFDQHGWELVETRKLEDLAVIELWLIKSTWSPTDCLVFLAFVIDPHDYHRKLQGEKTPASWIYASLKKPLDWMAESASEFEKNDVFEDGAYLYFGGSPEKKIPEFFNDLANLRQKFQSYYQ